MSQQIDPKQIDPKQIDKEQRIQQKRSLILDTALEVFGREGYADADVQVIADLAGVGKGTVYRHFGNKQDLFLAAARHSQETMGEYIRTQVTEEGPVGQVLREVAVAMARFYELHPEAVEIMLQERATFRANVFPTHLMYRAETRGEFEEFLQQAVDSGELQKVDVVDFTNAYSDLLYGTVVNGCLEGSKGHLTQRVERAFDIFLQGVLPSDSETA